MIDLNKILEKALIQDERVVSQDGFLLKNKIQELSYKLDSKIIELLLSDEILKDKFFIKVKDVVVFDSNKFVKFINNKEFLPDSYTAFKNKIGLANSKDEFISENNDVVLNRPYKDCVLAGGQDKEDVKRDEIFYNEILGSDDIDRLLDPKVFTNFKRIDKDGEHELDGFNRNKEVNKARGLSEDTITDNLLIKGNNLLALHSLKKQFAGKVKLIYIDPPYNTGNDGFKYNDKFNHSSRLTFMKNRLEVAKDLLKDDGVIFVQCDDNEQAYLKVLMDGIFGDTGFLNELAIKAKSSAGASGGGEDKKLKKNFESILVYGKDGFISFKKLYEESFLEDILMQKAREKKSYEYNKVLISKGNKQEKSFILTGKKEKIIVYEHIDYEIKSIKQLMKEEKINEYELYKKYYNNIFRTQDAQSSIRHKVVESTNKEGSLYSITYVPGSGKNKGKNTELFYYKNEMVNNLTNVTKFIDGTIIKNTIMGTLWKDIGWDGIANEGGVKLKGGKKPEKLLQRIIEMSTKKNDIVLDFFGGSGTTGAVAHKMNRQRILTEQMNYIPKLPEQRLINVVNGDQTGISKSVEWKGGGQFVYMEIMQHNQKIIEEIKKVQKKPFLIDVYNKIKNSGFINYKLDVSKFEENIEEFENLSLENMKIFLIELIDQNSLFQNYNEIQDKNNLVNDEDKKINNLFYT